MIFGILLVTLAVLPVAGAPSEKTPGYMTADETERYLTEKFQLNAPSRRYNKNASLHLKAWTEEEKAAQRKAFIEAKTRLDRAVSEKAAAFIVSPGVYRFPGTGIIVQGATNLTIQAAGCEFVCEPVDDKFEAFIFNRCDNVTLKGPLVLDSEVMPYFQGALLAFSEPGKGPAELKVSPLPGNESNNQQAKRNDHDNTHTPRPPAGRHCRPRRRHETLV